MKIKVVSGFNTDYFEDEMNKAIGSINEKNIIESIEYTSRANSIIGVIMYSPKKEVSEK